MQSGSHEKTISGESSETRRAYVFGEIGDVPGKVFVGIIEQRDPCGAEYPGGIHLVAASRASSLAFAAPARPLPPRVPTRNVTSARRSTSRPDQPAAVELDIVRVGAHEQRFLALSSCSTRAVLDSAGDEGETGTAL